METQNFHSAQIENLSSSSQPHYDSKRVNELRNLRSDITNVLTTQ